MHALQAVLDITALMLLTSHAACAHFGIQPKPHILGGAFSAATIFKSDKDSMVNYKQVLSFQDEVMSSERFLLHMSKSRKHAGDRDFHVGVVLLHLH